MYSWQFLSKAISKNNWDMADSFNFKWDLPQRYFNEQNGDQWLIKYSSEFAHC